MSLPTVSVIVPCYGYADVLEGCVDSVLAQEGVNVRILISDDCSPDDTPAVATRLAERDARIEYRRSATNVGLIATANAGLAWADREFVVLLSADDFLTPGSLQRATQIMRERPEVGMVYGRPLYAYSGKPMPVAQGNWSDTDVRPGFEWIRLRCRSAHNCISSPEVVVRTSVHRQVGGYDARCTHTSDLNLWLRIAAVSDIAYVRGVPQAIYRIHAGSMLRNAGGTMVDLRERRAAFDAFFEAYPDLENRAELAAMAGRALARQALWRASRAIDKNEQDGPDGVDELVRFAFDVYPDAARLREWHGFRVRRRIGAGRSRFFVPFLLTGAAHRGRLRVDRLRWQSRGV